MSLKFQGIIERIIFSTNQLDNLENLLMDKYIVTADDINFLSTIKRYKLNLAQKNTLFKIFQMISDFGYCFTQEEYDRYASLISLTYASSLKLQIDELHIKQYLLNIQQLSESIQLSEYEKLNYLEKKYLLSVVQFDGTLIKYIKDQSVDIQIEAFKKNTYAVRFLNNPELITPN